jgi:hypothetical protein
MISNINGGLKGQMLEIVKRDKCLSTVGPENYRL